MPSPYCYEYPRPSVTVDLVVFARTGDELRVLLVKRQADPFAGHWALPGGFLEMEEPIAAAARRELREETGLDATSIPVSFLGAYGDPGRDPRGRTISLVHVAVLAGNPPNVQGGDDAAEAAWRLARDGRAASLAFDHDQILDDAVAWLARGVRDDRLGIDILPDEFARSDVEALFDAFGGTVDEAGHWLHRMTQVGAIRSQAAFGRYERVAPRAG